MVRLDHLFFTGYEAHHHCHINIQKSILGFLCTSMVLFFCEVCTLMLIFIVIYIIIRPIGIACNTTDGLSLKKYLQSNKKWSSILLGLLGVSLCDERIPRLREKLSWTSISMLSHHYVWHFFLRMKRILIFQGRGGNVGFCRVQNPLVVHEQTLEERKSYSYPFN